MTKWHRDLLAYYIAEKCSLSAVKYVAPAFAGDVEAALILSVALEDSERGHVAVMMWRAKVPLGAFRAFLSSVWDHDHRHLIRAAATRRTLGHMFRYAAFPLPADMPERVTLWRGTSVLSLNEAKAGYSWTTERDVACWFAMRFENPAPLVLATEVAKTDIALFGTERDESEAVLMRPPVKAWIDGTQTDWIDASARRQAKHARPMRSL